MDSKGSWKVPTLVPFAMPCFERDSRNCAILLNGSSSLVFPRRREFSTQKVQPVPQALWRNWKETVVILHVVNAWQQDISGVFWQGNFLVCFFPGQPCVDLMDIVAFCFVYRNQAERRPIYLFSTTLGPGPRFQLKTLYQADDAVAQRAQHPLHGPQRLMLSVLSWKIPKHINIRKQKWVRVDWFFGLLGSVARTCGKPHRAKSRVSRRTFVSRCILVHFFRRGSGDATKQQPASVDWDHHMLQFSNPIEE